jgi:4-diphosphocytidyl-2-C-methyl-D-erythritol kinase
LSGSQEEPGVDAPHALVVDAPAKVNLFLRILHRRKDGYREVETLFQAVSLADEVRVAIADSTVGAPISLEVDGPDLGPPESNLAFRATLRFREVTGFGAAIDIRLTKRIPVGAGLGGGSSDAAAALRCLALLAGFVDPAALHRIAHELGSDVPFFLGESPLALGRGRGEVLTPISPLPEAHLVLALPRVHVSTAAAYGALSRSRATNADHGSAAAAVETDPHGGPRTFGFSTGLDWEEVVQLAENDFEGVVSGAHAELRASLEGLRSEGAVMALLSGSGAASFGLFPDRAQAERASEALTRRLGWPFVPARTLTEAPHPVRAAARA